MFIDIHFQIEGFRFSLHNCDVYHYQLMKITSTGILNSKMCIGLIFCNIPGYVCGPMGQNVVFPCYGPTATWQIHKLVKIYKCNICYIDCIQFKCRYQKNVCKQQGCNCFLANYMNLLISLHVLMTSQSWLNHMGYINHHFIRHFIFKWINIIWDLILFSTRQVFFRVICLLGFVWIGPQSLSCFLISH